jgi:hypothetical protein
MAYKLFINYGNGLDIHLGGAGATRPVKGARYSPGRGVRRVDGLGREVIEEEIIIELAGTFRQITDWIGTLNQVLEMLKGGDWHKQDAFVTLRVEEPDELSGYPWFSRIVDAWLGLDAGGIAQRGLGQQIVTLKVVRLDRWEDQDTDTQNLIRFPDGTGDQMSQGYLLNHFDGDAGHTNWGVLVASGIEGDLPANAYVRMGGATMGDLYLGCGWIDAAYPASAAVLPTLQDSAWIAGAGVTKTTVASGLAAGGNYAAFTWSGTGETEIARAGLPASLYGVAHGRPMKIMGRLQSGTAVADLWLKARVVIGGTNVMVCETEWNLYPAGSAILDLPVVYTPPEGLRESIRLDLVIYGLRQMVGGVTVNLDYVQLWPVDGGYRRLKCIQAQGGAGYVVDDAANDGLYWTDNAINQRAVYVGYGPRIRLAPGRDNVLAFANVRSAGWVIEDHVNLYVVYNRAKRNL